MPGAELLGTLAMKGPPLMILQKGLQGEHLNHSAKTTRLYGSGVLLGGREMKSIQWRREEWTHIPTLPRPKTRYMLGRLSAPMAAYPGLGVSIMPSRPGESNSS